MNMLIMGAPGAGKGTFSRLLREELNLNHISTGDIFRENISKGTPLGLEAKSYTEQGKLVPDSVTNKMVKDYLENLLIKRMDIYWMVILVRSIKLRHLKK